MNSSVKNLDCLKNFFLKVYSKVMIQSTHLKTYFVKISNLVCLDHFIHTSIKRRLCSANADTPL